MARKDGGAVAIAESECVACGYEKVLDMVADKVGVGAKSDCSGRSNDDRRLALRFLLDIGYCLTSRFNVAGKAKEEKIIQKMIITLCATVARVRYSKCCAHK